MVNHIVAVALEWWRASGPRTPARLFELIEQGAYLYAITDKEHINALYREAVDSLPAWEKPKS